MKRTISVILAVILGTAMLQCNNPAEKYISGNGLTYLQEPDEDVCNVELSISNLPDQMIYLAEFEKSSYTLIDSASATNGSGYFTFEPEQHAGTYRIYFGRPDFSSRATAEKLFIEFLWWKESFTISADYRNISASVAFDNSLENDVLGEFREYEKEYEEKMSAMYPLIDRYPQEDEFFLEASEHFVSLQQDREKFIVELAAAYPDLYASKLITAYLSLILQPGLKGPERMEYLRYHFFDMAPIDQPELIYSPVYNYRIIDYLSLYRSQTNTFSEQEEAFIEATDVIMANVSADPELRSFVVEYLLEGFNSFQMERVQTYIADNYVDESCTTDLVELAMQRVEAYKKMELGAVAADIRVRSIDNVEVRLSKFKSDYTLVIFWASHCEHCLRMMPKIKNWYHSERPENVEVLAISIDTIKANWISYVREMELPWINVQEPLGWEGKSASDYNIYATPTMFILDRKRVIRSKPLTYQELKRDVEKLVVSRQ
ncbi:thioredoxin-like domain-containing protein [Bacteroidota bacterium]